MTTIYGGGVCTPLTVSVPRLAPLQRSRPAMLMGSNTDSSMVSLGLVQSPMGINPLNCPHHEPVKDEQLTVRSHSESQLTRTWALDSQGQMNSQVENLALFPIVVLFLIWKASRSQLIYITSYSKVASVEMNVVFTKYFLGSDVWTCDLVSQLSLSQGNLDHGVSCSAHSDAQGDRRDIYLFFFSLHQT